MDEAPLLRTALYETHRGLSARLVPFAGWEMPLQFAGILAESRAVRTGLGLFDVSHMGRLQFEGTGSAAFLDGTVTMPVQTLRPGRARYGLMLQEDGGILDDVMVYRLGPSGGAVERLAMVCNGGNRDAVVAWLHRQASRCPGLAMADVTAETVMVAAQGPHAAGAMDALFAPTRASTDSPPPPSEMRPFTVAEGSLGLGPDAPAAPAMLSRTGYTGEDGFEVVVPAAHGAALWGALMGLGGQPCGLGARDVLRLEAGLRLHGADMDTTTTPLEASLERFVSMEKGPFVGREALARQQAAGVRRRLVGFVMGERAIPRQGYGLLSAGDGTPIGAVTSGGHSPTLDTDIGMGYVAVEHSSPGSSILVDIRGRGVPARTVDLPFYRRPSP